MKSTGLVTYHHGKAHGARAGERSPVVGYAEGVVGTPGHGKLHHHLGLLIHEAEGEELRSIYHFVKR